MSTFHHYCEYGDLGSMIIDLNISIRKLNSYLSEKNRVELVSSLNTITELSNLYGSLNETKNLILKSPINVCLFKYTNIDEVIHRCAKSEKCRIIEQVWRICQDKCDILNNAIQSIKNAINEIKKDTITDDTQLSQLIKFCGSEPLIDFTDVETIYNKTIKEQYETKSICKVICKCLVCFFAFVIIVVFICGMFCSCSNKNIEKEVSVIIAERNNVDAIHTCYSEIIDKKIIGFDSLTINSNDNDIEIRLLLLKDSVFVMDTTFILKSEYKYDQSDSLINRIIIIPTKRCEVTNNSNMDESNLWSHLFRLIYIILLAGALILILLILRRQWENENEMNQKILNDRLKVQKEWQEILQSRYRLDIRRQELEMSIEEKERKAQIDEDFHRNEHERKMQTEDQKNNCVLMGKALEAFQSINNQRNTNR